VSYGRNVDNNYSINNIELENIESEDLGVTFDSGLKFSLHINEKINNCKIAHSILGVIKRNVTYLD